MIKRALFLLLLLNTPVIYAKYNLRHKVYRQLEQFNEGVSDLIDGLNTYVYNCNEWRGSRFTRVGKLGNFIDKYILMRDPEDARIRLEIHEESCVKHMENLAVLLPEVARHQNNVRKFPSDKKEIQDAINFLGEGLSIVCGFKCPVHETVKKQLGTYDVLLRKMKSKFRKYRLKNHFPTFIELYREKFLVAICASAALTGGVLLLDKADWVKQQAINTYKTLIFYMGDSWQAYKEWSGMEVMPGQERRDELERQCGEYVELARNFAHDAGLKKNPNESKESLSQRIMEALAQRTDPESGVLVKVGEQLEQELKNVQDAASKGANNGSWSPYKIVETFVHYFANVIEKTSGYVGSVTENGSERMKVTSLIMAKMMITMASGLESTLSIHKSSEQMFLWGRMIIPPMFIYTILKQGFKYMKNQYYVMLNVCIDNIDGILSKYAESDKDPSLVDEGLLLFWLAKLAKSANASAISREDRMRIADIIKDIKNPDVPISQKLRALDVQWRFRKAMPSAY